MPPQSGDSIYKPVAVRSWTAALLLLAATISSTDLSAQDVSVSPDLLHARHARIFDELGRGLLLLPTASGEKGYREMGFYQASSALYVTGLERARYGVVLVDATRREVIYFGMPQMPESMVRAGAYVPIGDSTARALGLDAILPRAALDSVVSARLLAAPGDTVWVEEPDTPRFHEPFSPLPLHDQGMVFAHAVTSAWPQAIVRRTGAVLAARQVKDAAELAAMRAVGEATVAAFRAGIAAIAPGVRQRTVEVRVVTACLEATDGVSFWPWAMSGPNAPFPAPFAAFNDYRHLDRIMQTGEVVRLDVGCELNHYAGDFGRTVPVSGQFTPGQREANDLLAVAYEGGLAAVRAGAHYADILAAAVEAARRFAPTLQTPLGIRAAEILLGDGGTDLWQLHGIGLDAAEPTYKFSLQGESSLSSQCSTSTGLDSSSRTSCW